LVLSKLLELFEIGFIFIPLEIKEVSANSIPEV